MKFLIIQPWISYRGAETVSVKLCKSLYGLGHSSKIACLFLDKSRLPEGADNIKYILPPVYWQKLLSESKILFYIFCLPVLFWTVLRATKDFDVLNPHNPPSLWASQIVKIFTGKKIIWTVHNIFPFQYPFLVDKIVTPTKMMAQQINRMYGKEATVLYNAL